ncbi:hypothetical protein Agub_g959, partial [Astrephomene gubernaculifera]
LSGAHQELARVHRGLLSGDAELGLASVVVTEELKTAMAAAGVRTRGVNMDREHQRRLNMWEAVLMRAHHQQQQQGGEEEREQQRAAGLQAAAGGGGADVGAGEESDGELSDFGPDEEWMLTEMFVSPPAAAPAKQRQAQAAAAAPAAAAAVPAARPADSDETQPPSLSCVGCSLATSHPGSPTSG